MDNKFLDKLTDYLVAEYGCHCIILYGSWAEADHSEKSDVDLACFTDNKSKAHDTKIFQGRTLDAWIYDSGMLDRPEDFIHLKDGTPILDCRGQGQKFLENINQIYLKGPEVLSKDEASFLKRWLVKMYERAAREDMEGNYRYHWLLTDCLEIYFKLHGTWYLGPKKSFAWLSVHDKQAYRLWENALAKFAAIADLKKLINYIVNL